MHEYRRFVQDHLDQRGWRQADLVRASGLSRAHVSKILRDHRDRLGQMPDESTMVRLAQAFSVSVETVRTAAARALRGYADDGEALTTDLSSVSIDALLMEIRRRVQTNEDQGTQDAKGNPPANGEARPSGAPMNDQHPDTIAQVHAIKQRTEAYPDEWVGQAAARDLDGPSLGEQLHREVETAGEESQDQDHDDPA